MHVHILKIIICAIWIEISKSSLTWTWSNKKTKIQRDVCFHRSFCLLKSDLAQGNDKNEFVERIRFLGMKNSLYWFLWKWWLVHRQFRECVCFAGLGAVRPCHSACLRISQPCCFCNRLSFRLFTLSKSLLPVKINKHNLSSVIIGKKRGSEPLCPSPPTPPHLFSQLDSFGE